VRSACEEVPWLEDSSNKRYLQDELHRPVLLVNDVEAFMVGEWFWGELRGLRSGVVLSVGESMGSALLWNDVPQQGRRGSIMELEKISLDTDGKGTPPGSSEQWLSGRGLRKQMERQNLDQISVKKLFKMQEAGYIELKERFEDKMAHLLGIVIMMLDPERIVLGGGLTRSHERWLPEVEKKMDQYVMEQFQGVPSLTLAQLRGNDVISGPAAFWDWNHGEDLD
jgi:glucokinase